MLNSRTYLLYARRLEKYMKITFQKYVSQFLLKLAK